MSHLTKRLKRYIAPADVGELDLLFTLLQRNRLEVGGPPRLKIGPQHAYTMPGGETRFGPCRVLQWNIWPISEGEIIERRKLLERVAFYRGIIQKFGFADIRMSGIDFSITTFHRPYHEVKSEADTRTVILLRCMYT